MLIETGPGKYLSKVWRRKRAQALVDRTRFSQHELDWLEIGEHEGRGQLRKETYEVEPQPIVGPPYARPYYKRRDVRDRPEAGGRD